MTTDDLDPTDIAYVNSLTPDGRMYTGHLTVLTYLDEEGDQQFLVYAQMDREISSVLGLLEMAKLHMLARCDGADYCGLRTIDMDDD